MKTIFKLFKFQIDEIYDVFKTGGGKKFVLSVIKLVLLMFLFFVLSYVMIFAFKLKVGSLDGLGLVSMILLVTQLVTLAFSVSNIISTLYMNKNLELLWVLPATHNQVFLSKLMVVYVKEISINIIGTLPILLSVGILMIGKDIAWYFLASLVTVFFLPILPMAIASLLSVPVMFVVNILKRKTTIAIILIVILIGVLIYFYMQVLTILSSTFNIAAQQMKFLIETNQWLKSFSPKNIPFVFIARGLMSFKDAYFIPAYIASSALILLLATPIVRAFFFRAASTAPQTKSRTKFRVKSFKKESAFVSLFKKELIELFRNPGGIFSSFSFTLLMPLLVFLYDRLFLMLAVNQTGAIMINGTHLMIVAIFAGLSNIYSSTSISKEGARFAIMKVAPVDYYKQTAAKVIFNLVFTMGALLITTLTSLIYFTDKVTVIFTFFIVSFLSLAHISLSIDLDLRNPALSWSDESSISVINNAVSKSIAYGILHALVVGFVIMMSSSWGFITWIWVGLLMLTIIYALYRCYILFLRVSYKYELLG
ncbi:MAG: hypothetical protein LBU04_03750 [Christensenellaceae bacterium]|jgi:ABC-2 type transport system permease protein|nr:hypothetical protein [Christensenellaceae bacterium]